MSKGENQEPVKFSKFFGLDLKQNEIDFLDIYAHRDLPLFIDPYGITAMNTKWAEECEIQIATYFQYLIDSINNGDKKTVDKLLNSLHEVDEISLGYATNSTRGRGIGPIQAKILKKAFQQSRAIKSGDVRDIADLALLIPNINRDKISDITANILKRKLISYTQKVCAQFKIPIQRVAINNAFNFDNFKFESYYDELPVIGGMPKILLPLTAVRQDPDLSKPKFYRDFILEFLKAEHGHAWDSLATVLKDGRVVVRIGDLKQKYPMSVDFIYEFSKAHPQVLEEYKTQLRKSAKKRSKKPILEPKRKALSAKERIRILNSVKTGNNEATNFHKISFVNLIYVLGERISNPKNEKEINEGRKRIDIVFNNSDKNGFFKELNSRYKIQCPKIIVECKNYGREIGNPEIDQLMGRLNKRRGLFGILICRSIENKKKLIQRCKDVMHDEKGYIIVLDDSDMAKLINFKMKKEEQKIDELLRNKYDNLIM